MKRRLWPALFVALALGLATCAAEDVPAEPTLEPVPSPAPEIGLPHGFVGPVVADAERRTGIDEDRFIIERPVSPAHWPDTTLGCPQPGEEPIDGLVEGWVVILRVEGLEETETLLEYRVRADDGSFRFCEESYVPPPT